MAGAFTHIALVNKASYDKNLDKTLRYQLQAQMEFLTLGSVSPDLPYLALSESATDWADLFHIKQTNKVAENCIVDLKSNTDYTDTNRAIMIAWLMGYISHLVADATIHPIVQAIVGPYSNPENRKPHRECEMVQDVLICKEKLNIEVAHAEISSQLKRCANNGVINDLTLFWQKGIIKSYPNQSQSNQPEPLKWYEKYCELIDAAEGGSGFVALFRHAGLDGHIYRTSNQIKNNQKEYEKYYTKVKLPGLQSGKFAEHGFAKAQNNIVEAWNQVNRMLLSPTEEPSPLKNWNLDTGMENDSSSEIPYYWSS